MDINRRNLLTGLAGFSTLPLLAGCGRASGKQITLRFWNGFTGPDGRTMLRIVKRFNDLNPDVNVLMQRADWATLYKKIFVAGAGGRAPEVFVLHTNAMVRFAQARFVGAVDDLIAGPDGLNVLDLDANVWQGVEVGGKHYGLPLDVHVMGMYYNKRLFRQAGIVDAHGEARPPTNRAEFLDACERITRKGQTGAGQWGFVFANFESNFYTLMRQWGGTFFNDDNSRCLLNDPRNVAALQFGIDMVRKLKVAPPPENFDSWIGFRQGKVGMAWEGVYMLDDLRKQTDLEFGAAPVPQMGIHPAVEANSHNICLRADLNDAQRHAAWRFARFLSDNSLDWAAGGQIPARKSLRATPRFASMTAQYALSAQIPIVDYMPRLPFVFEFVTEFDDALEHALRGSMTAQQALDTATANVNAIIARQRQERIEAGGQA